MIELKIPSVVRNILILYATKKEKKNATSQLMAHYPNFRDVATNAKVYFNVEKFGNKNGD